MRAAEPWLLPICEARAALAPRAGSGFLPPRRGGRAVARSKSVSPRPHPRSPSRRRREPDPPGEAAGTGRGAARRPERRARQRGLVPCPRAAAMWIQVRTIDGSQTRTIEDVSRKATIEELRERVWALFDVRPECQRLFYRGKQLENGYTLFDYDVGLNDIIQLLVRPDSSLPSTSKQNDAQVKPSSHNPPKVKKTARGGSSSQPSTSARTCLLTLALDYIR